MGDAKALTEEIEARARESRDWVVVPLVAALDAARATEQAQRERAEKTEARVAVLEKALASLVKHLDGLQHSEDCSRTSECDEAADAGEECSYCALPGCPSCECGIGDLQNAESAARLLLEAK